MLEMPVMAALLPDFMTPELQVMAWTVLVFAVLLGVLWKFALGPIMHALEEREHNIQHNIDEAANKLKEATARLAEYDKKINASKDEAAKIIAEGKRDVDAITAEEKAKAKLEIEAEKERAKREINLAKDAAVAELRKQVVSLTGDIATKIVQREIKSNDHGDLINKAFDEIGKRN